jgi:predicted O-methyltransferase YrrM
VSFFSRASAGEPAYLADMRRPAKIRKGRNVQDGYSRGVGLQFGTLADAVRKDPVYAEAVALAHGRTIVAEQNRMNLFLILRAFLNDVPGHIIEFGSYKGGNAIFMASVLKQFHPGRRIWSLDTFTGMPETDATVDAHKRGDFQDVDLDEMRSFAAKKGLDNLEFVKGLFQDTSERVLARAGMIALAHIDCDIYSAVAYSYEVVKPWMSPGGYLAFDDACFSSCLGATEAVEELLIRRDGLHSEQIYPHFVFRTGLGERSQEYRKQWAPRQE